ncbi:MAG: DUF362 domain-containing protein [Pleomorphochaeta sp.]
MSDVSIVECKSYELETVLKSLKETISSTKIPEIKGKTILVKPNILSDVPPELSVSTHPSVVEAVIIILKEMGAKKIYVGDSPAIHPPKFKAKQSKIYQICEKENVEWVNFHSNTTKKRVPYVRRKVAITQILDEVDFCISVAKFKTHELMYTTGVIKNMFGLVPGFNKSKQHVYNPSRNSFAKFICGLYKISKTEYNIMDAVVGMEGAGPGNGDPRKVGYLLASNDGLALDTAQAIIMGYNPLDIPIIKLGIKKRLSETRKLKDINYTKLDANDLVIKDYKRISNKKLKEKRNAPIFLEEPCIKCKKCIDICPANALSLSNNKITINENKCIKCYCCHEVCPANAIKIDK